MGYSLLVGQSKMRKVSLETIVKEGLWTEESIDRALSHAAYHNDVGRASIVLEQAPVDRQCMEAIHWEPLMVAARNNSVDVVDLLVQSFGPLEQKVMDALVGAAIASNAKNVVRAYVCRAHPKNLVVPIHTAISFGYVDPLLAVFQTHKVSLDDLHDMGVIQRLVERKMWAILSLVVTENK
jgi:hypothetical protein